MNKKLISIIAPMYNEEFIVKEYCEKVLRVIAQLQPRYDFELVLVDDGSVDRTLARMCEMKEQLPDEITIVKLTRNFGLEAAISSGLKIAAGEAVVVMDADLQDPPELLLDMILEWESGSEIVIASREKRTGDGSIKRLTAYAFYKFFDLLSGRLRIERDAANYRLLDRRAVALVLSMPEVNPIFRIVVPYVGLKTKVIFYDRVNRFAGKTKYSIGSMYRFALDNLTSLSIEPLRKLMYITFFSFFVTLTFFIGIFLLPENYFQVLVVISVISLFFSILFFCVALIAEYLGQIFIEVKQRPTSLIGEYLPSGSVLRRKITHEI